MLDGPVRFAFLGPPHDIAARVAQLHHVRGAEAAIVADSLQAAVASEVEFDAVIVDSYAEARIAIEWGTNVLLSAPVFNSSDEAEALLALAEENDVILRVGSLPRNAPSNQRMIDHLSSGKLGSAGLLRVNRWSSHGEQSLAAKTFGDIDLAVYLFRSSPTEIFAVERCQPSFLQIHLGFPHGGMAILDYLDRPPYAHENDSLSLIGTTGASYTAYADHHRNLQLLATEQRATTPTGDPGKRYVLELQAFVDELCGVNAPKSPANEIKEVHRIVNAVRRSLDAAQVVHDPERIR